MNRRPVFGIYWVMIFLLSACTPTIVSNEPLKQGNTTHQVRPETNSPADPESTQATNSSTTFLPEESPPTRAVSEFVTDFSKHTVPYSEIRSGGPSKDGIPAIDKPTFIHADEADSWLKAVEPVILLKVGKDVRAYPLQILIWHEIINDVVGDLPLTITFCPLCNTAIVFERTFEGKILDFGATGRLRYSNLIMYDRQTETWWQQANGEAIAGKYAGLQLEFYPAAIISWQEFKSSHPEGMILSRETGFNRSYGQNPYAGYDDVNNPPFLYDGPQTPDVLPPVARALTIDLNGEAVAFPYDILEDVHVVNDAIGDKPIVIFWSAGTASALDASSIAGGRDVGSATAYSSYLDRFELKFEFVNGRILDQETGSEWNMLGQAVAGELAGKQLSPVVAINHFWFSWAVFKPETRIYQP